MRPPAYRRFGAVNLLGTWTLYKRDMVRGFEIWGITIVAPALQSVLFALVFTLALGGAKLVMGGVDFTAFLIPGLIAFTVLERGFESTGFMLVFDKLEEIIRDIVAAPLTPAETVTGFALMSASASVVTGVATGLALFPFLDALPRAPLALFAFAFLGGMMMGLVGLVGGLWADKWDHISAVQTFIVIPAIYMSGVFFSLDRLAEPWRTMAGFNPVYFVIDGIRYGLTGRAAADPATGLVVVLLVDVALWLLCWRLVAAGYKLKT